MLNNFELDSNNNFDEEPPIGDDDVVITEWLTTQELETLSPEDAIVLAEERMASFNSTAGVQDDPEDEI